MATFFFFAFIMFGRVAYRGSLSLGFIKEFRFGIVYQLKDYLRSAERTAGREIFIVSRPPSISLKTSKPASVFVTLEANTP